MKIDPYLSPCTILNSKWIKDLNIKPATLDLREESIDIKDLSERGNFYNLSSW
ncbi:hypothetical protein LEMLEM_LOCUS22495 [Lemmus lemmus]